MGISPCRAVKEIDLSSWVCALYFPRTSIYWLSWRPFSKNS